MPRLSLLDRAAHANCQAWAAFLLFVARPSNRHGRRYERAFRKERRLTHRWRQSAPAGSRWPSLFAPAGREGTGCRH